MTRFKKHIFGAIAIALVGVIGVSSVSVYKDATALAAVTAAPQVKRASKYDETIKQHEKEKEKYQQMANQVQQQINNYKSEYNEILKLVKELDKEMEGLSAGIMEASEKMAELDIKIQETAIQLTEAQRVRDEQYEKMKARIKYVYENGETNYIDVLLSTGSLADILNRVEYVAEISKYDDEMFEKFRKAANEVADTKAKLVAQKDAAEAAKKSYETSLEYAQKLSKEKNKAMEECAAKLDISVDLYKEYMYEIETKQKTIDQVKKEKAAADAKAKQDAIKGQQLLQQQIASGQMTSTVTGTGATAGVTQTDNKLLSQMIWPSPGCRLITSPFGPRKSPTAGASSYHKGLDIGARYGATTIAALAGTVVGSAYNNSMGNYVMIDHGNGVCTIYMHASKNLVRAGQYVKQGQAIQLVGSTGYSTGAHLHFAIQINGTYVNPANYVKY